MLTFLPEAAVLVQSLGFQILPISMEDEKKQEELQTMNNQLVFGGKKDPTHLGRSPGENVKLAATAVLLNARLRSHDMPVCMHEHALRRTRSLVDTAATPKFNLTSIARSLKQEFDSVYGPAWQCVVGTSFGSYVTHSVGGFVYFSIDDSLSVLLFKTEVKVVREVN